MKKIFIIVLVILFISVIIICNFRNSANDESQIISPIDTIDLVVPEPSGLFYDRSNNTLWTVSDENSTVYNIDINGNIIKKIKINGIDLEGISKVNDTTLAVILERDREIILLKENGKELSRFKLNLKGELNKGLEGISYDSSNSLYYLLNEKEPGLLLKLDSAGNMLQSIKLDLASDYSGLNYVAKNDELWIVSDEDETLFKCTTSGKLIKKYKTNIEQIEGIAIDENNSKLFLISDPSEKLFIYNLP